MIRESLHVANPLRRGPAFLALAVLLTCFLAAAKLLADEPYARSRDYDLQHSKISLRFDLEQKKVPGEVTHSLSILRDGTAKIVFDSAGLTIQKVTVNKAAAKFETTAEKLIIPLASEAKSGDKFDVTIRYEGKPTKGMYFILADRDYPDGASSVDHRLERQAHQRQRRGQGLEDLVLERVCSQLHLPDYCGGGRIRRGERVLARHPRHLLCAKRPRRPPPDQLRSHSGHDGAIQQENWRRLRLGKICAGHGR